MKLSATASELVSTIGFASQVSPTSSSLAAYTGVHLDVTGSTFTARGSDGDTTVASAMKVSDTENGFVLVPPKPLLRYLSKLNPDTRVLVCSDTATSLSVTAQGASAYKFVALAVPFPAFSLPRRDKVAVDLDGLADAVVVVRDCSAALSGGKEKVVQLVSTPELVLLHATDRYRLARAKLSAGSGFGEFDGLVPLRVLELVAGADPTHVQVDTKSRQLIFHGEGVVVATRLAQDPFPTVESVLNQQAPYKVSLNRAAVCSALRRLAAVAAPGSALRVAVAGDQVVFTASNASAGSGEERVTLDHQAPGEVELLVNFDYAVSAFNTHADSEVGLSWSSPHAAVFVTAAEPVPSTLVIMPMKDE